MPEIDDEDLCRRSWRLTVADINGADAIFAKFEQPWMKATLSGDVYRKIESALSRELADVDWSWPWFDEWLTTFVAWQQFPQMWRVIANAIAEPGPHERQSGIDGAMGKLVIHTAMSVFFCARLILTSSALADWTWRLAPVDNVEERVASQHRAAIGRGDLSATPPFFPGDRTMIKRVSPYQAARRK